MPHDIIDNHELQMADAVRPLPSESVRAHFAVGYFFISGFKAIADQPATVQELRLLIGNTSDRATIEQLAEVRVVDRILSAKRVAQNADTTALEREIDERVYRLHGLTADEIKLVEETRADKPPQ